MQGIVSGNTINNGVKIIRGKRGGRVTRNGKRKMNREN